MQRGKFSHDSTNKEKKVDATEVLSMIQHGAQEIIRTCNEEDEDIKANIDKIIESSMKKTDQINAKLESFSNDLEKRFDLNSVPLTGEDSKNEKTVKYFMPGEDASEVEQIKQQNLINKMKKETILIDIGERKKAQLIAPTPKKSGKVPADENGYSTKGKFKGWKVTVGGGFEHQFFDNVQLDQLEVKEIAW